MSAPDTQHFRLPSATVRRTFVRHTLFIVALMAAFHFLTRQAALERLAGALALAVLVLVIGYAATARRVWVSASSAGLVSTSYLGRTVQLPWTAPVSMSPARMSGYKGHRLAPSGSGFMASHTDTIFVPQAIAGSAEFARCVQAWSPASHPLRSVIAPQAGS